MLKVRYRMEGLSDTLHVEPPEEDTLTIPFEDMPDLLYFPGCHVVHYRDARIKNVMTRPEGDWEFVLLPGQGKQ